MIFKLHTENQSSIFKKKYCGGLHGKCFLICVAGNVLCSFCSLLLKFNSANQSKPQYLPTHSLTSPANQGEN